MIKKLIRRCIFRCGALHILYSFCSEMVKGCRTYRQIKQKNGGAKIFLQYYQGTGDVYLSAAYLKHCEAKTGTLGNAVFAVNGANAYRAAALMGIESIPIITLPEKEAYALVCLTRWIGPASTDIQYLHYMSDYPMYTCFLVTLAGLHGIGFMDLYRDIAFGGEIFKLPAPQWDMEGKGPDTASVGERKALLAPAANSIAKGPDILFWRGLAQSLKQAGYKVYTNVSAGEKPVAGTEPAFIPYKALALFLDKDAVFIGYRSGLCDLIASLECKKIIIYPKSCWPVINGLELGSTLCIFSLNKMGTCRDAIELVYSEKKEPEILSEIMDAVTGG